MVVGGLVVGAAQPFRLFFAVLSTLIKFDRRAVGIISLFCDCVVQVGRGVGEAARRHVERMGFGCAFRVRE